MTQAAHPWSFFQVVASRMDGAFDDCITYSRFVPVFLRQVDPGVLRVMMIFNDQDRSGGVTPLRRSRSPEPFASLKGKLREGEGSGLMGTEMLRCAQHDSSCFGR
jgi:hypothetical protein